MKMIAVVALALVAIAAAAPTEEPVKLLTSKNEQKEGGGYSVGFKADNGIERNEEGEVKQVTDEENKTHDVIVVRGFYSYPGADGNTKTITYFADERGYRAEGEDVPKPVESRR